MRDHHRPPLLLPILLLSGLLGGCATVPFQDDALPAEAAACLADFQELNQAIESADARDYGEHRPAGFPWLRSTRFLASFRFELDSEAQWEAWLGRLAETDRAARRAELANLLDAPPDGAQVESRIETQRDCAARLNEQVLDDSEVRDRLIERVAVPDDYISRHRWLGLYPLTRLFVLPGVDNLHEDQMASLTRQPDLAAEARWRSYRAEGAGPRAGHDTESGPATMSRDPLGIPVIRPDRRSALFDRHAPVWRMEERSDADRLGHPRWKQADRPIVDTDKAMEYRFTSFTRFEGRVRLQLNYMVWLPERPRDGFLDLLGGHIDGAIWRVTLAEDGTVLAGESLHVCGCYYMVFPGDGVTPREEQPGDEPILVGPTLPDADPGQPLRLTRRSGNHYLIHVDTTDSAADVELSVTDADTLRSLSHPEGRRSLFGEYGLVPGTERRERFLLWTMGVPSPGAMRQPGRHAIAFTGRRHFDDPRVLEESLQAVETP